MALLDDFIKVINEWKAEYQTMEGKKLTNAEIAKHLDMSREHFQKMLNGTYHVENKHYTQLLYQHQLWRSATVLKETSTDPNFFPQGSYSMTTTIRKPKIETDPEREGVIFVPIAAQANYTQHYTEPVFIENLERIYIPGFPYRGDRYRIFEVAGQSMEPTFKEGYYVVTEQVEHTFWNSAADYYVYVVVTQTQVMLKRIFKKSPTDWIMLSDNEDFFPQFTLPVSEIKELWYVRRKIDWEMPPPKKFEIKL